MMMRAAEILESEKDSLAHLMTLEMGKTLRSAVDEAVKCAWVCRYYAENAERFLADELVETPASRSFIRYQPMGVILVIMPWNYPFWQAFRFIAPGLMAGNVGLLKHASNVPQCAMKIEELLLRAGVPEGVFQTLLVGSGSVDRILDDPRIAAATLTGSEGAGVKVGTGAAQRIKKVVLELGGSDPFIVMPSANLEDAVAVGIKARVANNGQSCIAAKRFIVHEQIADKFQRAFVAQMEKLTVGDPFDAKTDVGPLANAEAVTSLDADVRSSIKAGAKASDRRQAGRPPRKFLSAHRLDGYSERFSGLQRRTVRPGGLHFPREELSTKRSASPMTAGSASERAPGRTTRASRNASSMSWKRAWSSSIKWCFPTPGSRLAA